jgi:hypothetical protein
MQTPSPDDLDKLVAELMTQIRESRHLVRQELETEKICRRIVLAMIEATK